MPQNPIPQPNSKSASLTEQSVRDFIELQKEELRLRHQENTLRQLELQHSYELSKESLKQQGEYLKAALLSAQAAGMHGGKIKASKKSSQK